LGEHVANAGCAHTYEHLDEIGSRYRIEGNVGFAGDGAGKQGLARPGRTNQKTAFRHLPAELLKTLWILEELDDFLEFFLGFVDTGNIG